MLNSHGAGSRAGEECERGRGERSDINPKFTPQRSTQMKHEMCFTHPLGGSQANQVDNEWALLFIASLSSFVCVPLLC